MAGEALARDEQMRGPWHTYVARSLNQVPEVVCRRQEELAAAVIRTRQDDPGRSVK